MLVIRTGLKQMTSKILVTGAAGFIGSHLCNRIAGESSNQVIGIDNLRSGRWNRLADETIKIQKDLNDYSLEEFVDLLEGVDVLFHLAAEKYNSSKSTPERLIATNISTTERLFRAASIARVKRTVFTSSLYAYGSMGPIVMDELDVPAPNTLYGVSKLAGEGFLRSIDKELGLSWNVARLFFIYGPFQFAEGGYRSVIVTNFQRVIHKEAPLIFGDGEQSLDYVYIDDCIDALLKLAYSQIDREVVNVASGDPVSINRLTNEMLVTSKIGQKVLYTDPDWTHGSKRFGSPSKIERLFGWRATSTLSFGLGSVYESLIVGDE